jgi:hypothetical protein
MTEAEWNSAPIADLLLHTLDIHRARHGAEPSDSCLLRPPHAAMRCDLSRKHMLLAFAVVRRYWSRLAAAARRTIAAWEATEEGERERDPLGDDYVRYMDLLIKHRDAAKGETAMALWLVCGWWPEVKSFWSDQELPADWRPLFHDVFGDAFRPVAVDSAWLTSTVVALAQAAYDERLMPSGELDPARLAVLADALEDAACTDAILSHLRSPGPHVRGCWALDLILGKQ